MSTKNERNTDEASSELNDIETLHDVKLSEATARRCRVPSRDTICLSDFFVLNDVDKSTQDMFVEYDKSGDGTFSKTEVMNIIVDLKKQFQANADLAASNRMMKLMLMGAVIFFFLLVGALFGVSIAVASLTKETTVANGLLYNKDGSAVVATDSHAEVYQVESFDFGDCISVVDIETIKSHIQEGKNVLLQKNADDGANHELKVISASGATFNDETGVACFPYPQNNTQVLCLLPETGSCNKAENRRRSLAKCNEKNDKNKNCQDLEGTTCLCVKVEICEQSEVCECAVIDYFDNPADFQCPEGVDENSECPCYADSMTLCSWNPVATCYEGLDCSICE
jgi:hypothetical protein